MKELCRLPSFISGMDSCSLCITGCHWLHLFAQCFEILQNLVQSYCSLSVEVQIPTIFLSIYTYRRAQVRETMSSAEGTALQQLSQCDFALWVAEEALILVTLFKLWVHRGTHPIIGLPACNLAALNEQVKCILAQSSKEKWEVVKHKIWASKTFCQLRLVVFQHPLILIKSPDKLQGGKRNCKKLWNTVQ